MVNYAYRTLIAASISLICLQALIMATISSPAVAEELIHLRFIVDLQAASSDQDQATLKQKLLQHVEALNSIYRNSAVDMQARLIVTDFISISDHEAEGLLQLMTEEQGPFRGLFARTSDAGADYTILFVRGLTIRGIPKCGRAVSINLTTEALDSSRSAVAVLDIACGSKSLAHELGHLMGLNHGQMVDRCQPGHGHSKGAATYANGFGVGNCDGTPQPGEFGTIMVGGWMDAINGDQHSVLPMYSNPRIRDPRCGPTQTCGDPNIGDAARFLNENAAVYAGHESTKTLHD